VVAPRDELTFRRVVTVATPSPIPPELFTQGSFVEYLFGAKKASILTNLVPAPNLPQGVVSV
jgi:hypothetical protein